ncbi:helix-turn-helix transcriptional regulator [Pseudonocardia endophytica]|uniref:helix-turn-helix transcriptional regulator n=1 Tax=Pseudonocardia endophytica TaxID=401976 RepID=UPI0014055AB7|nr:AAA family ATPase [Pseudonocardia endophytica]
MPRPGAGIGLVGRDAERAELLAVLDRARSGRAGAVLLSGDAGVGKSRLVAELAGAAGDAHVVVGRCLDIGDASLPYLPFTEALSALRGPLPDLLDRWPALRRLAPWLEAEPDPAVDRPPDRELGRLQLFDGMLSALTAAGGERPLLLAVEDLHWADRSTRELLAFLLSRLDAQHLAVVGTYRSDDLHRRHPLRPVLAELARLPAVTRLDLAPLDLDRTRELVRALSGDAATTDEVARIADRSEGNAFFAEELVAAGCSGSSGSGGLPDGLAELLLARSEQLSAPARAVLRVASVADRSVRHELLAAASGLGVDELEAALREAVVHHVLVPDGQDAYSFRHALLREAVHDDLLPGERSRLHARFADLLAERPDEPGAAADLARHAFAAHDLPRALAASVRAASEAARRGGPAEMLLHLERALEIWPAVEDPESVAGAPETRLTREAAWAASASGDPERGAALGRRAVELADALGDRLDRADARIRYALRLLDVGALMEETVTVTDEAVALLEGDAPGPDLAWAHAVAGRAALRFDLLEPSRAHAERAAVVARAVLEAGAPDEATRRDVLAAEADALITCAFHAQIDGGAEGARTLLAEAVTLAAASGNPMVELRTMWNRGVSFLEDGMLDAAQQEFASGESRAADYGISWGGYGLDHKVGHLRVAFQRGEWDVAGRIAASVGPAVSAGVAGLVAAAGLLVSVARGELDDAEARIRSLGTVEPMHDQTALLLGQAGAECALWRSDPTTATERVDAALRRLRLEVPYHLGELVLSALGIAALADRAAAHPADADRFRAEADALLHSVETVAERGLPRGTAIGPEGRAWLLQARAEHTRVHDVPSPDAWTAVVDGFGYGDRYREAQARHRRAEALLARAGRAAANGSAGRRTDAGRDPDRPADPADLRRAAAEDLRAAAAVADELGARPLSGAVAALAAQSGTAIRAAADRAVGDAGRPVVGDVTTGPLTPREHAVLEQVALGLTNRRIGEELFISEKTVSVHLSRLMAKLGAAGRAEAVSLAYERGLLVAGDGSTRRAGRAT